jgi:glutamate formiminotransferase/formiminotetrahydrofolate cyclodeaminase
LEVIRRGEYEELKKDISTNPDREPDSGPTVLGSAGATVIGAREFLIAYNVNLTTTDEGIASKIARVVRHSSGGLRFVKALGMTVDGRAQVSMNLTNFKKTPLPLVVETIRREAERYGVGIHNCELVGLIPQKALIDAAVWYTQLDLFSPEQILEQRMMSVIAEKVEFKFLDDLADGTPTPGGGSAAAYTAAMGASLVSMVSRLTVRKKGYENVEKEMQTILTNAEKLREELSQAVVQDAQAFTLVMDAYKKSKTDPDRESAIQDATLKAAQVPLTVAQKALKVAELALRAAEIGNQNAITDAGAGGVLAQAAVTSAGYNVRINLASLTNKKKKKKKLAALETLEDGARDTVEKLKSVLNERGGLY